MNSMIVVPTYYWELALIVYYHSHHFLYNEDILLLVQVHKLFKGVFAF